MSVLLMRALSLRTVTSTCQETELKAIVEAIRFDIGQPTEKLTALLKVKEDGKNCTQLLCGLIRDKFKLNI